MTYHKNDYFIENHREQTWRVFFKGGYIGDTVAVSGNKAINNMRYRLGLLYEPISNFSFKAKE